ncbi:MAG TPA: hypothetical protein VFM77_14565, partial [Terriglobales bacterium]|nr:hypothetical protein [Terriglobales bacterium]
QELADRKAFLEEQIEQAKQRVETKRRGLKLGYLKLANQAPRCSHLKNDGEPCRAPAMGQRSFCVFHSRAYDCETNQRLRVGFLEDPNSLQLVLKQIMEQVLSGRIQPQTAALLLRATQIANGVLKERNQPCSNASPYAAQPSAASVTLRKSQGNPVGKSGLPMASDGLRTAPDLSCRLLRSQHIVAIREWQY